MSTIQITVRSISDSPAIEYNIRKQYAKLTRLYNKISNCKVVVDVSQNHKHKGKIFSVSIDITIPGRELVSRKQNQNLYVAIRNAFSAIERLLEKSIKRKITLGDKFHHYQNQTLQNTDPNVMMHN